MKKIMGVLLLFSCTIIAMHTNKQEEENSSEEESEFVVTKEMIAAWKQKGFDTFIDTKKKQHSTLTTLTGLPFGIGKTVSTLLEGLGIVEDTDHAKCFLGRIFEDEKMFRETAGHLEQDHDNIAYLQKIFNQLDVKHVSKQTLIGAMKEARHNHVPDPKQMGTRNNNNEYILPQKEFCQWAACNFLAFHWLEQQEKQQRSPHSLRRRNASVSQNR